MKLTAIRIRLPEGRRVVTKTMWHAMKLTVVLLTLFFLQVSASGVSQEITLSAKRISLEKLFKEIESQTGYVFFYNKPILADARTVDVRVKNIPLDRFLEKIFSEQPVRYNILNKSIIVFRKSGLPPLTEKGIEAAPAQVLRGLVVVKDGGGVLPNSTVTNLTTKKSVVSSETGAFELEAAPGHDIEVSCVGYKTKRFQVTEQAINNPYVILMEQTTSELDAVQILAYGKTTRRLNTGSVVTVTAEEIAKNPVQNVLQVLQHRVPGMFIQQQTGLPGGRFDVEIRGRNSFGDNAPLYIIDGVAYPAGQPMRFINPSSTTNGDSKGVQGGSPLNFIDPSQIESIDVLKDADATSIYGSRGAYGVVLITTKRGKAGAPRFNVNVNKAVSVRGSSPELLNTEQYLMLRREAFKNDGTQPGAGDLDVNGTWPEDRYTDWLDQVAGLHAPSFMGNFSYSGGAGNVNYLFRGNYNEQKNTQKDDGSYRNMGLGFNLNTRSGNGKFSIDLSGSYSSTINDMVSWDFALGGLGTRAPNAPDLFLPDGKLNWEAGSNPANGLELMNKTVSNNLIANLSAEYRPVKGLVLQLRGGYNVINANEFRAEPSSFFNPANNPSTLTNSSRLWQYRNTATFDPNIRYSVKAGSKGILNITAGMTLQDAMENYNSIRGANFLTDAMLENPSFADRANVTTEFNRVPDRYLGYFSQIGYNWANKYLLNLNGRYDGSTRFGRDNQFGFFGSVGGAWILSEENWFQSVLPVISFAKFRGSYGTTGGDGIGNYMFLDRFSRGSNTYQGSTTLVPATLANPSLQWEVTNKMEIALETGFLENTIWMSVSYYQNSTSNQLIDQPLSSVTGFSSFMLNSPAEIENTGWEGIMTLKLVNKKDFSWSAHLNITIPKNELVAYPQIENFALNNNYVIGESTRGIKLYEYAGVNPETGFYNFYKDGEKGEYLPIFGPVQLDPNTDRTAFVDLNPKYYGGITNDFSYRGFNLGFTLGITNRMGPNYLGQQTLPGGFANTNVSTIFLNRWQQPGDITDIPKLTAGLNGLLLQNNFRNSTGAYERATYARMNNMNLSYDLPQAVLSRFHLSGLRISLQGQNLFTISKYRDLDPQNLGAGTAPLRTYSARINLSL